MLDTALQLTLSQDVVARFTFDSATEFLFGAAVHSLSTDLPYPYDVTPPVQPAVSEADKFVHAFAAAQNAVRSRLLLALLWPFGEIFFDKTK